jgi:hypothetical protein
LGKHTWVVFLDLRKAIDTVPHNAMLHKLAAAGVGGRVLWFVSANYQGAQACAEVGGLLTDTWAVERGVKQANPLFPTLFNVFINDALRGLPGVVTAWAEPGRRFRASCTLTI